jgi:hypothetical protein
LVLVTLVLAVLLGWSFGGRLSYLERLPYQGLPLLAGALAALLGGTGLALAGLPARPTQGAGLAGAAALTLAFCLRSRAVAGLGLVGVGLLLNALAILANGGMPVSADAARRAGVDPVAAVDGSRHVAAGPGTALRPLSDVIPVPLPLRPEVVSVGDMLGAAGMAQLVATAMLAGRAGSPRATPAGSPAGAGGGSTGRPAGPTPGAGTPDGRTPDGRAPGRPVGRARAGRRGGPPLTYRRRRTG